MKLFNRLEFFQRKQFCTAMDSVLLRSNFDLSNYLTRTDFLKFKFAPQIQNVHWRLNLLFLQLISKRSFLMFDFKLFLLKNSKRTSCWTKNVHAISRSIFMIPSLLDNRRFRNLSPGPCTFYNYQPFNVNLRLLTDYVASQRILRNFIENYSRFQINYYIFSNPTFWFSKYLIMCESYYYL